MGVPLHVQILMLWCLRCMAACDAGMECREPEAQHESILSDETVLLAIHSQHRFSSNSSAKQAMTKQAQVVSFTQSGYSCGKLVNSGNGVGGQINTENRGNCEEQCDATSGCNNFAFQGSKCHLKTGVIQGMWGRSANQQEYNYVPPSGNYNTAWKTCYKVQYRCDPCFTCKAGTESLADVTIGSSAVKMCQNFCSVDGYCNGAITSYAATDCTQCSDYLSPQSLSMKNALDSRDSTR